MQILKQSTQVIVRVGPFVDVGDGFTPQTDIGLAGNEAELLKNASVEVDISGRTFTAVTNCRGWYDLTLTTGDTDTVGLLTVVVQDDSDCLPVFRDFQVIEEEVYADVFAASAVGYLKPTTAGRDLDVTANGEAGLDLDNTVGTLAAAQFAADFLTSAKIADNALANEHFANGALTSTEITSAGGCDMTAISGDTVAADNLEAQYDGDGLIGDTYPFTQAAGAALGGGLSILTTMASATAILGDSNNLANASTSDDSRWTADDNGSGAETIFRCTPADTSHIPVEITFEGYYDKSGGPGATLQVYNFNTVGWDTIATFTNAGADEDHETPLSHAHKAPANGTLETVAYTLGDVMIKFKQDSTAAGDNVLLIDYMVVGFVGSLVTAEEVVDEWETQSQANPTGFHVNVREWLSQAVTLSTGNKPDVNIDEVSDDSTAAATLELFVEALEQATGKLDSGSFKDGAITAAAIADGAIDNATFAADVDAGIAAMVWDKASALTVDFGTLLERAYELLNNKMNVTDANGVSALRAIGDGSDIATGSFTDAAGTTVRAEWSWS